MLYNFAACFISPTILAICRFQISLVTVCVHICHLHGLDLCMHISLFVYKMNRIGDFHTKRLMFVQDSVVIRFEDSF